MASLFSFLKTTAGQATYPTASTAALVPTVPAAAAVRIAVDVYCRVAFGTSSVVADTTAAVFAPGSEVIRPPGNGTYFSVVPVAAGTVNYSLTVGTPSERVP